MPGAEQRWNQDEGRTWAKRGGEGRVFLTSFERDGHTRPRVELEGTGPQIAFGF